MPKLCPLYWIWAIIHALCCAPLHAYFFWYGSVFTPVVNPVCCTYSENILVATRLSHNSYILNCKTTCAFYAVEFHRVFFPFSNSAEKNRKTAKFQDVSTWRMQISALVLFKGSNKCNGYGVWQQNWKGHSRIVWQIACRWTKLSAPAHFYKRLSPAVRRSVGRSVTLK